MSEAPTLADAAVRHSFEDSQAVPIDVRTKINMARRFVLDEDASSFLSDLGHATYRAKPGPEGDAIAARLIDQTRRMARAPHALTWIEFDFQIFHKRTLEAYRTEFGFMDSRIADDGTVVISRGDKSHVAPGDIAKRIGWLIEQKTETQFVLIMVWEVDDGTAFTVPWQLWWTVDDSVPMRASIVPETGKMTVGLSGSYDRNISIVSQRGTHFDDHPREAIQLLVETIGELRSAWALLAAINDVPMGMKHVEQSHGYTTARGRYRKFLDHSVISILLPKGRDPRKVAMEAVALSRRRAHQVRGHFRTDWRSPLAAHCQHDFSEPDPGLLICQHCKGRKFWVHEHQRGDASLGFVLHNYRVESEAQ